MTQIQTSTRFKTRAGHCARFVMAAFVLAGWTALATSDGTAQVVQADYDFEASGFITPAGVRPPGQYGVAPVGYYPSAAATGASCDSGGCDSGSCDGMGFGGGMQSGGIFGGGGGGCASGGCGGVFGELGGGGLSCGGCGIQGCGACKGLSNLRHMCLFCRGQGCSACQLLQQNGLLGLGAGGIGGFLSSFRPYTEAGLCAQRWYDVSLEMMLLGHNTGASGGLGGVTSRGISGPVVLGLNDTSDGGMEPGFRLSGSLMMGAGANVEATWIGGHEWDNTASVSDAGAGLFSFISEFGNTPLGGFDDTDRSLVQRLTSTSEFDTIELNYRRRTVWPYCRFQGSWLVGLRYIGYDDGLTYETVGQVNNTGGANTLRYFQSDDQIRNSLFGAQAGGDFWWNITSGVSMGVGGKIGALKNDIDRSSVLRANSLAAGATAGQLTRNDSDSDTAIMGEFEWKLVYRLSHSWTVRTSYYMLAIDDIAFGDIDGPNTVAFVNPAIASPTSAQFSNSDFAFGSLVNHGFSIGAEYVW